MESFVREKQDIFVAAGSGVNSVSESEKKRENLTTAHNKSPVNQLFTRLQKCAGGEFYRTLFGGL
jgi:hypothetical protein